MVFDGCAGQGDTGGGLEFFRVSSLTRAGVLDGLGLVENGQVPRAAAQPFQTGEHAVRGDDKVAIGDGRFILQARISFRRMGDEHR